MPDFNERSRRAYNAKADGYEDSREGLYTGGLQKLLLAEMKWDKNQSVLDVACGDGRFLASVFKRKPIKGFGIDISEKMAARAAAKNPGMEFYVSGCEKMPFPDASMDIITVCAAYHHFPDTAAFAEEARRIVKPGGSLYVADMYMPSFVRVLLNPFVPFLLRDGDVKIYSPDEIIKTFERFGFVKINLKITGNVQILSFIKS